MYQFKSRVRYSEVELDKKLDLSAIIDYFQDCSTFQSEDIGLGIDYLRSINRAWLLSSWQIIVNDYPELGQEITSSTWAYDFNGIYGYRNFMIENNQKEVLAYANSIWVYIDTKSGRPTRVTDDIANTYGLEEKIDMNYAPRKISFPKDMNSLAPFSVIRSNIDTNNHVNNGQYIKMAEEFLPEDFVIKQMRADYRKAARLDDLIVPKLAKTQDGYIVVLADTEDKPFTIIEFK